MTDSTFYEVLRLPWPDGSGEMIQELIYRVDNESGQVVPSGVLTQEQRAALQALIDCRGPEVREPGGGNSLTEISYDSPEAQLSRALALALLSEENLKAYQQALKNESICDIVRAAHKPVCLAPDFYANEPSILEDGTALVEVSDSGPNWTNRYTLYILALAPEIKILQAYTPCGEHTFNTSFQREVYQEDESGQFDDLLGDLLHSWVQECPDWFSNVSSTPVDYTQSFITDDL